MTELRIPKEDAQARIRERIALAEELGRRSVNSVADYEVLENEVRKWSDVTRNLLGEIFADASAAKGFSSAGSFMGLPSTHNYMFAFDTQRRGGVDADRVAKAMESMRRFIPRRITALESILETLDLVPDIPSPAPADTAPAEREPGRKVFVVHGHDEEMKQAVARTLETLELTPVILHEKPDGGRTVIEKFTDYSDVDFAVILLSPDDVGHAANEPAETQKSRARQNVVLELGFFLGKLGRSKVLPLYRKHDDFDMPSDYHGVLFTEYDGGGVWKFKLVQELAAIGVDVDANRLTRGTTACTLSQAPPAQSDA